MVKKDSRLSGVLNINKPAGMTSHDVVDRIRRAAQTRKVGHTGTLDPMATGVLPLCLGKATKVVQFLIAQDKEYLVEMTLGLVTDSQDTTGTVVARNSTEGITPEKVQALHDSFSGKLSQIPPMVSAKHYQGQRLYELARKGIEVKREPCEVEIFSLVFNEIAIPRVVFRVVCSKGTYIRTLCADMGEQLGCGAAMSGLVRTRCGAFRVEEAVNLDDCSSPDVVATHLETMDASLSTMPAVIISPRSARGLLAGQSLRGAAVLQQSDPFKRSELVRVKADDGTLLGVGKALVGSDKLEKLGADLNVIKPVKILVG